MGWATGMGRFGTCLMPFFVHGVFEIDTFLPFLLFSFMSLICIYCAYKLPYDTTGKYLDFNI